jgi:tRNA (guanine-N7-)-methyltransferase
MLNTEYAYFLAPGGMLYTITDVKELGIWMVGHSSVIIL